MQRDKMKLHHDENVYQIVIICAIYYSCKYPKLGNALRYLYPGEQ